MRVLPAERQLCDRHVIQHDIEMIGSLRQNPPYVPADHLEKQPQSLVPVAFGKKNLTEEIEGDSFHLHFNLDVLVVPLTSSMVEIVAWHC